MSVCVREEGQEEERGEVGCVSCCIVARSPGINENNFR